MNLETYIINKRLFCESPGCMAEANVCRELCGGGFRVTCWQHDPETILDFDSWLSARQDSLPEPQDFTEYLNRRGDSI